MHRLLIAFCFLFSLSASFAQQGQPAKATITYEGKEIFINGLNAPWNKFGGDFGTHIWWGALYESQWFDDFFKDCADHGVNVVRVWIHCDGRTSPLFTEDGTPYGLEPGFFLDMDDMFRMARKHHVLVMPCVWSFDMCKFSPDAGPNGGGHHDLLNDEAKMKAYIENVWEPMVKRYADECNLFAWEVCNEPEWALDRTAQNDTLWAYRTDLVVPIERMQRLTGWMASVVHKHSNKMVTTGSASIRFNSDHENCKGNWWSDKALAKATDNMEGAYLDFYQVHYYDYMVEIGGDLYDPTMDTKYYGVDKPIIIGETPADTGKAVIYKNHEVLDLAYNNGYAGLMYWSYNATDGFGVFDDMKKPLQKFANDHPDIVELDDAWTCDVIRDEVIQATAKLNGKNLELDWIADDPFFLKEYAIELSDDGEKFTRWKVIPRSDEKTVAYRFKKKLKNKNSQYVRIYKTDVYGMESASNPLKFR